MNNAVRYLAVIILSFALYSCEKVEFQREFGAFEVLAGMVQSGVKPIALSYPMRSAELDLFLTDAELLAEKYDISFSRESALIDTDLFDSSFGYGKEILILYRGNSLLRYELLQSEVSNLKIKNEYSGVKRENISRSFGRLLGYSNSRINELLAENSSYRSLLDFGIDGQELIWFYNDLPKASAFYRNILGLKMISENENSATFQIAGDSKLVLKRIVGSNYSGNEAKSVALALLTDRLQIWYEHLKSQKVEIKYPLKVKAEGAHDGFVAVDPEGYLLEFEMFRMHPENEQFIPELKSLQSTATSLGSEYNFYASITWLYYKDMLPMERFMTERLGLEMSADQGWAKIYRLSNNSYLGLVDEKHGMNSFSDNKLVEVKFNIRESKSWEEYLMKTQPDSLRAKSTFKDLGGYTFRF